MVFFQELTPKNILFPFQQPFFQKIFLSAEKNSKLPLYQFAFDNGNRIYENSQKYPTKVFLLRFMSMLDYLISEEGRFVNHSLVN